MNAEIRHKSLNRFHAEITKIITSCWPELETGSPEMRQKYYHVYKTLVGDLVEDLKQSDFHEG